MKKSILIGALAALMLFAFVACDNGATGLVYRVEAVQNEVYVTGETPKAEGFSFTGYTTSGDVVSINPADVDIKGTAIWYQGAELGTLTVKFETPSEIVVDATGATATYYAQLTGSSLVSAVEDEAVANAKRDVDPTGVVVTAKYDGGEKVLDNEDLVFTNSDWTVGEKKTVTVTLPGTSLSDTYEIEVLANRVKEVSLTTTEDYVLYIGVTNKDTAAYASTPFGATNNAGVYMVAEYQGGESVVVAEASIDYYNSTDLKYDTTTAITSFKATTDANVEVKAKYVGNDGIENLSRETSCYITVARDSVDPESITISNVEDLENIDYSLDENVSDMPITVTAEMKSGGAVDYNGDETGLGDVEFWTGSGKTPEGSYFTIDPVDLSDFTDYETVTITVSGKIAGVEFSKSFTTVLDGAEVEETGEN